MKSRNYPLLLTSQFLGALGDNAILAVILGPIMGQVKTGQISGEQQSIANIIYTSLLFVPYLLFASLAGYLNDRYSKTSWLLGGNALKLAGTGVAAVSLGGSGQNGLVVGIGYFIVGIGACLYSPAKYGILPEILPAERLVKANGTVEFLTLIAILAGNIIGAKMVDSLPLNQCYFIVLLIYGLSLFLVCFMQRTVSHPEIPFKGSNSDFFRNIKELLRNGRIARILVGTSLFWLCGALLKMNFQPWGQQVLKLETMTQIALLGLWLSIGVMIGSILAGQLYRLGNLASTRKNGWLLAISIGALGSLEWVMRFGVLKSHYLVIGVLLVAGILAGLFLIPLNAALQAESHQGKLGKTIATQNLLENCAMLGGSMFAFINIKVGFDPSQLFLALALLVALVVSTLKFQNRPEPSL
ncbi:MAG: MFS transporter [Verrucomicrobiota bacterium]|nr:MFS transporter [Verrucomicrobiota bacterium]